jgi:hypothetical protein
MEELENGDANIAFEEALPFFPLHLITDKPSVRRSIPRWLLTEA